MSLPGQRSIMSILVVQVEAVYHTIIAIRVGPGPPAVAPPKFTESMHRVISVLLTPPLSTLCASRLPAIRKYIGPHQYPLLFRRRSRVKSIKRTAVFAERRRVSCGVVSVKAWLCILLLVDCGPQKKKMSHNVLHGRGIPKEEGGITTPSGFGVVMGTRDGR
jgi:hypothetical protein